MQERPEYLKQELYCLSNKEAEKSLNTFLQNIGNVNPKSIKLKKDKNITITNPIGIKQKFSYAELINELRKNGISSFFQETIDNTDEVFGGTFSMAHTMPNVSVKVKWAGFEKTFNGISRNTPSEIDLADDIEFYKEEACIESVDIGLEMTSRNYRGFLFSCIALIDSYINKHIVLRKYNGFNSAGFDELCQSQNCEHRIELFVNLFCDFSFDSLKSNRAWTDFKKIKNLRNEVVHSLSPYFGIEVKELATNFNLSIHGIGTLLKFLQEGQNRRSLGFIERIRTSKVIYYNEVLAKSDGSFQEKKIIKNFNRSLDLNK
jgi:hypothetical protein